MTQSVELMVTGMKCGGCETNVKDKLSAINGVLDVAASSKDKTVSVEFDEAKTGLDAIKAAIVEAGFKVE
ncbi:MAG: heavy-metal-associated domain-containing protein [Gammaproteobacteria bacterium]